MFESPSSTTAKKEPPVKKEPILTSRFIEHFDDHPLTRNSKASVSLQNMATSSLPLESTSKITRSASSNM